MPKKFHVLFERPLIQPISNLSSLFSLSDSVSNVRVELFTPFEKRAELCPQYVELWPKTCQCQSFRCGQNPDLELSVLLCVCVSSGKKGEFVA